MQSCWVHPPRRLDRSYIAWWVEGRSTAVPKFPLESGGCIYSYEVGPVALRHSELDSIIIIRGIKYVASHRPPRLRSKGYFAVWIQSQVSTIMLGDAEGCLKAERARICIAFQTSAGR